MARLIVLFYVFFWKCLLFGSEPTQSVTIPDYSSAFETLKQLGIHPIPANAKWVAANKKKEPTRSSVEESDELTEFELLHSSRAYDKNSLINITKKGNAWLIPNTPNPTVIIAGKVNQTTQIDKESPANLEQDAKNLIETLKKKRDLSGRYFDRYGDEPQVQHYIIFAAQIHQLGHKDLANQITYWCLNHFNEKKSSIDSVITAIAQWEYDEICHNFDQSKNLKNYHQDLKNFLKKYPRGIPYRRELTYVQELLDEQFASKSATTAPDNSNPPNVAPWSQRLLKYAPAQKEIPNCIRFSFATQPFSSYRYQNTPDFKPRNWLLYDQAISSDPLIKEIQSMGIEAIPILANLLTDRHMLAFTMPTDDVNILLDESTDDITSSSDESEEVYTQAEFSIPPTRASVALSLIISIVPIPKHAFSSKLFTDDTTYSDIKSRAMAFYHRIKSLSKNELALTYISENDLTADAINYLATTAPPEIQQKFESDILSHPTAIAKFILVHRYLEIKKSTAKDFCTQYCNLILKQPQLNFENIDYDDTELYVLKEFKNTQNMVKILTKLANTPFAANPDTLLDELLTKIKNDPEVMTEASASDVATYFRKSKEKSIKKILDAALNAKNPKNKVHLALHALNTPSSKSSPQDLKEAWQKLINDPTPILDQDQTIPAGAYITKAIASRFKQPLTNQSLIQNFRKSSEVETNMRFVNELLAHNHLPSEAIEDRIDPKKFTEIEKAISSSTPSQWFEILSNQSPFDLYLLHQALLPQFEQFTLERQKSFEDTDIEPTADLDDIIEQREPNDRPLTQTFPKKFFSSITSISQPNTPNPTYNHGLKIGESLDLKICIELVERLHRTNPAKNYTDFRLSKSALGLHVFSDSCTHNAKLTEKAMQFYHYTPKDEVNVGLKLDDPSMKSEFEFTSHLLTISNIKNDKSPEIQGNFTFVNIFGRIYKIHGSDTNLVIKETDTQRYDKPPMNTFHSFAELEKHWIGLLQKNNPKNSSNTPILDFTLISIGSDFYSECQKTIQTFSKKLSE